LSWVRPIYQTEKTLYWAGEDQINRYEMHWNLPSYVKVVLSPSVVSVWKTNDESFPTPLSGVSPPCHSEICARAHLSLYFVMLLMNQLVPGPFSCQRVYFHRSSWRLYTGGLEMAKTFLNIVIWSSDVLFINCRSAIEICDGFYL